MQFVHDVIKRRFGQRRRLKHEKTNKKEEN